MSKAKKNIIVGSSGFIGKHLFQLLKFDSIGIDYVPSNIGDNSSAYTELISDIRLPIDYCFDSNKIKTIYNLAAIHKTPGHDFLSILLSPIYTIPSLGFNFSFTKFK